MKIEKLTPEQEKLMLQVRDEWIDLAFNKSKEGINKPLFEEGIKWLYADLLKKPNPKVVYCDSWLSCLITIEVLKQLSKKEKLKLGASVRASVRDSVGDSVRDSVGASVRASVRASVGDSVWDSVWDSVRASVGDSVRDSVLKKNFQEYSNYNGMTNFGWVSFYDFFERINVLDNFNFKNYKKLIQSNCFNAYEYENFVFAIQPPVEIKYNDNKIAHSIDSPAITFEDGTCYYSVNGRRIPENYFLSICDKKYTMDDFIKEENEEIKSTCIALMQEKFGDEYIVNFFRQNLEEVDTYVDKKSEEYLKGTTGGMNVGVYTLFKGEINGEKIAYVRCYCPSTDRMFFLGVHEDNKTAKDAIASIYRIPSKLKGHIKSISRQGERFSTILTDEGKGVLNGMSEKEIADVTNLSGNEYFSLMKFEY